MSTETTVFTVDGMTCAHCEASVKEEISEVPGVTSVKADHTTGNVEVIGSGFTCEQIAEAVAEAGYTLA